MLASNAYCERVLASQAQAIGVTGVPAFLIDWCVPVLGAQPHEVFAPALKRPAAC